MADKNGQNRGRPTKWESPEQVEALADAYFEDVKEEEWTITGLALALDTNRDTLCNYEKKDEFSDTIKRMKTKVEMSYEKSLRKRGNAGDIFGLKNFGWRDRQELAGDTQAPLSITLSQAAAQKYDLNTSTGEDN